VSLLENACPTLEQDELYSISEDDVLLSVVRWTWKIFRRPCHRPCKENVIHYMFVKAPGLNRECGRTSLTCKVPALRGFGRAGVGVRAESQRVMGSSELPVRAAQYDFRVSTVHLTIHHTIFHPSGLVQYSLILCRVAQLAARQSVCYIYYIEARLEAERGREVIWPANNLP